MRPLRGFATLCALFVLSGCGSDGSSSVAEDPSGTPEIAADPEVTCGTLSWPVSVMDGGVEGLVDDAEVEAALKTLRDEAPMDAPSGDGEPWRLFARGTGHGRDLVAAGIGPWSSERGPGPGATFVLMRDLGGQGLKVISWGGCQLHVAVPAGRSQVEVKAPEGGVDAGTSAPIVMVNERDCTSSRDPQPFLGAPEVIETADRVTVTLTSETLLGSAYCAGNPSVPVTLELAEPIGDRQLVDGGTWPPRPIQVG